MQGGQRGPKAERSQRAGKAERAGKTECTRKENSAESLERIERTKRAERAKCAERAEINTRVENCRWFKKHKNSFMGRTSLPTCHLGPTCNLFMDSDTAEKHIIRHKVVCRDMIMCRPCRAVS